MRAGEVIAFPTETVFGLGASIYRPEAIHRIYQIKSRSKQKPLSLHLSSLEDINTFAKDLPPIFRHLAKRFLPGPLTMVVSKKEGMIPAQEDFTTIGIRIPDHEICRNLISYSGPILATSANFSNKVDLISPEEVWEMFQGRISGILSDGKSLIYERPSTVISFSKQNTPLLLREGAIPFEDIISFSSQCLQKP
ncbi:MAG: hypothetical protein Tsb0015_17440 [Simkaniaceae bacterium]